MSRRKLEYFCPVPTKMIGFPVEYDMETAAPTLLSIVSNFESTMPSTVRGGSTTAYLNGRRERERGA